VLGVRYFVAHSADTKTKADNDSRLRLVATSPDVDGVPPESWSIYRVSDAPLVEPLSFQPVVATGVAPGPGGWEQQVAVPWFWYAGQLDRPVVADGPASWRHAAGSAALRLPRRSVPAVHVGAVRTTGHSVSFRVDRTGVPVMVKVSYFPNWVAHGADGPYRATPNFMIVVPTSKQVTLEYGTTTAEWAGRLLTLAGLVGLAWLARRSRRTGTISGPLPDRTT
jgi:hypothetical protein